MDSNLFSELFVSLLCHHRMELIDQNASLQMMVHDLYREKMIFFLFIRSENHFKISRKENRLEERKEAFDIRGKPV